MSARACGSRGEAYRMEAVVDLETSPGHCIVLQNKVTNA
jgi:hypothetical protein